MATRATTNIKKRLYQIAYRDTEAYAEPADAAAWTTFLGTFTQVGYVRRSDIEGSPEKGDLEELDDGSELVQGWNLNLKFTALQTGAAEITEFDALQGSALDVMFYNIDAQRAVVFKNAICNVYPTFKGGETDSYIFEFTKKNAASVADILAQFDIPQA